MVCVLMIRESGDLLKCVTANPEYGWVGIYAQENGCGSPFGLPQLFVLMLIFLSPLQKVAYLSVTGCHFVTATKKSDADQTDVGIRFLFYGDTHVTKSVAAIWGKPHSLLLKMFPSYTPRKNVSFRPTFLVGLFISSVSNVVPNFR